MGGSEGGGGGMVLSLPILAEFPCRSDCCVMDGLHEHHFLLSRYPTD
jgi:hypothetical protein